MRDRHIPKPKPPNAFSVYLGKEPERSKLLEALDEKAATFGVTRSQFIQMIASGELFVSLPPRKK